ncbi:crtp3 [Symbiodinium sp. CCMP2456]|nr:crtp3 [Symbiodinium sp. CCMP2456]
MTYADMDDSSSAADSDDSFIGDGHAAEKHEPYERLVFLVFIGYVVLQAADRVFMKRVTNSMHDPTYNLMLWNIIWPVTTQFFNLAYMLPYIWLMRRAGHKGYTRRFLCPGNPTATSGGPIPVWQLGLFSLGDQICTCMQGPSVAFISQTMMTVMSNTLIIFMAALSAAFLGTRYRPVHYASGLLVVVSVLVDLSNKLSDNDCSPAGTQENKCLYAYKGAHGMYYQLSAGEMLLWYGMFLLSILPLAASSVYKQYVLQGRDVEVVYATWWSGVFQVLWGILCVPLFWIKLPGQEQLPPGQTFQALLDTCSCMLGNVPHPGDEACASNPSPVFWYVIYLAFNVSWVVLRICLIKYLSAVWTTVATVLCMDLTNVFGMIPFLAGGGAQIMSLNDWLASVLASIALWVYSMEPEIRKKSKAMAD